MTADPHVSPCLRAWLRLRVLAAAVLLGTAGCGAAASSPARSPSAAPVAPACPTSAAAALHGSATASEPVPGRPTGALVCSVNVPARRTPPVAMSSAQSAALAALLDTASPTDAAARCRRPLDVTLVRFASPGGDTDVIGSGRCRGVVYAGGAAYRLSAVARTYLASLTAGRDLEPDLTGLALPAAAAAARRAHRTLMLLDTAPGATGTVVLQSPTLGRQIAVLVGAGDEPPCHPGQLRLGYQTGEPSAGSDSGTLWLRNEGGSWCRLAGPIAVTGLTVGRPVTPTVTVRRDGVVDLSPHAPSLRDAYVLRRGLLEAEVTLGAEYRDDDSAPDGSCQPHWVVPRTWRVEIAGRAFRLPDGAGRVERAIGAGGLVKCRGSFGALPVRTVGF